MNLRRSNPWCVAAAALAWLGLVMLPALASAHDPGLSSITLGPSASGLRFRMVVNNKDLPEARRATAAGCSGAGVVTLLRDGEPRALESSCTAADDPEHTAFEGAIPAGVSKQQLAVEVTLQRELPRGHSTFLRELDARAAIVGQQMLSRAEPYHLRQAAVPAPTFFVKLGVEHILTGVDHLLFLAVLLIGAAGFRRMALLVSAFTLAHSASLALSTLGWVAMPAAWVEPLIAASIVFVGVRNLLARQVSSERLATAFGFGLVHGLGFASALEGLGVKGTTLAIVGPLVGFNLGVELGQIAIGAVALPLLMAAQRGRWAALQSGRWLSGVAVAAGVFWFVQRVWSA